MGVRRSRAFSFRRYGNRLSERMRKKERYMVFRWALFLKEEAGVINDWFLLLLGYGV